jgi:aerobic-type carbon monoxide dehydrogenase small subunit (CoxS/CutS family)
MTNEITITVNGKQHAVQADPETPLVYVLRNELGLHATKFGCGLAQCGVCSVLLDGQEIRSCVTPVASAAGHQITTLEGLADVWAQKVSKTANTAKAASAGKASAEGAELHPVQQAWIELQVPQCGYCQNGMMMQAVSLLNTTPHPSKSEIRAAMDGHICRCGTYMRIVAAIERAATQMSKEA